MNANNQAIADKLNELAPRVYGESWKGHLARHHDVYISTVGHWSSGNISAGRSLSLRILIKLLEAYVLLGWVYDRDTNTVGEARHGG